MQQESRAGGLAKWIVSRANSQAQTGVSPPPVDRGGELAAGPVPLAIAGSSNERLYEAYNELHALAQEFRKPFDAPAILVVGHQTDGKSALVEALMGFQFNHVGGGTKTRRPITLHMKYNAACSQPRCFLVSDDYAHEQTLEQIQVAAHCSFNQFFFFSNIPFRQSSYILLQQSSNSA